MHKRKIVSDYLQQRIRDLHIVLEQHYGEIEQTFSLTDTENYQLKKVLKMYLIIDIFEFIQGCKKLNNSIHNATRAIRIKYKNNGLDELLKLQMYKRIKETLDDLETKIAPMRNKIAAHRYTDDRGCYITIEEITKLISRASISNLKDYFKSAYECFSKLYDWYSNPINKDHLILVKEVTNNFKTQNDQLNI
jgi:hypothetical protein